MVFVWTPTRAQKNFLSFPFWTPRCIRDKVLLLLGYSIYGLYNLPSSHHIVLDRLVMSSQINALPRWTVEMEYNNFTRFSNTVHATASAIIVQSRMTSVARPNLSPDISESLDSLLSVMEMGKVCCPKNSCYLPVDTYIYSRSEEKSVFTKLSGRLQISPL